LSTLISKPLWRLSSGLLTALTRHRAESVLEMQRCHPGHTWDEFCNDDIAAQYNAFLLDPGLGPTTYITADGRMVWDEAGFWGVRGTLHEALGGLVAGIKKTGVVELCELLPARLESASTCLECVSGRWIRGHLNLICPSCRGLGWTDPNLDLTVSVLEG
jgi:hypothetical protein